MAEKKLKARIVQKHETEENWKKAVNFIPKQGEIIVYDIDENYAYERFKIGDGNSKVNDLPFIADKTQVATDIANAIAQKTQVQIITWEEND